MARKGHFGHLFGQINVQFWGSKLPPSGGGVAAATPCGELCVII